MNFLLMQHQLHNGIRYVPVALEVRNSLSFVESPLGFMLMICYLTADYSTTTLPILILFVEGCWARCQLRNRIRYVSIISKLRNSLSSVESGLASKLALCYSTADYSTMAAQILILFAGGVLCLKPATQWYMVQLCHIKTHESANPSESCLWTKVVENSMKDSSTTS